MAKEIIINLDEDANVTKLKQSARSKSTRTKYLGDWKKFVAYTEEFLNYNPESKDINISKENAENSIVRYVSWLKEDKKAKDLKGKSEITNRKHIKLDTGNSPPTNYKLSTLKRKIASIKYYFKTHRGITINTNNQSLVEILDGIGQEYKDKQETKTKQAYEILKKDLKQIIDSIPDDENITNIRDRAMILLGWWSVCRRSEILNLTYEDITFFDDSFEIHIRFSKTDQTGEGEKKLLPYNKDKYCPYSALKTWLEIARIESGPLFYKIRKLKKDEDMDSIHRIEKYRLKDGKKISLSDDRFVWILKKRAENAGIESWKNISGHSLRRGFITQATLEKFDNDEIKLASGHQDTKTVDTYKNITDKKNKSPAMKMKI